MASAQVLLLFFFCKRHFPGGAGVPGIATVCPKKIAALQTFAQKARTSSTPLPAKNTMLTHPNFTLLYKVSSLRALTVQKETPASRRLGAPNLR